MLEMPCVGERAIFDSGIRVNFYFWGLKNWGWPARQRGGGSRRGWQKGWENVI